MQSRNAVKSARICAPCCDRRESRHDGGASRSHDLGATDLEAEHSKFDGLIGLNFLRHFNYEVRSAEGRIVLENLAPLVA